MTAPKPRCAQCRAVLVNDRAHVFPMCPNEWTGEGPAPRGKHSRSNPKVDERLAQLVADAKARSKKAVALSAARDRVIEAARAAVATAYDAAKPEAAVEAAAEELRAAVRALEALEVRDA